MNIRVFLIITLCICQSLDGVSQDQKKLTRLKIPIVIHQIWHHPSDLLSISELSRIVAQLNEDFKLTEIDKKRVRSQFWEVMGDPGIEFQLVRTTPNGAPTAGITFRKTDIKAFDPNQLIKVKFDSTGGVTAWPVDQYLNIWICNIAPSERGIQTTGLSTRPQYDLHQPYDGVVLSNDPSTLQEAIVHEVAHYLGLPHPWGDEAGAGCNGDDGFSDTPNVDGPSNCGRKTTSCGNIVQWENYMELNSCGAFFTQQQVESMRAILMHERSQLLQYAFTPSPAYEPIHIEYGTLDKYAITGIIATKTRIEFQTDTYYAKVNLKRKALRELTLLSSISDPNIKLRVQYFSATKPSTLLLEEKYEWKEGVSLNLQEPLKKMKATFIRLIVEPQSNRKEIPDYGQVIEFFGF